jgi:hypothetical protein
MFRFSIRAFVVATTLMVGCTCNSKDESAGKAQKADSKVPESIRIALENAEQFELLSLEPCPTDKPENPRDTFYSVEILGRTQIKDMDTRKKLVAAFQKGVEEHDGSIALCFDPRHGIRIKHDGKTIDFIICFYCYQVEAYADGKDFAKMLISNSPQAAFDEALQKAGVPLAKPGEK